MIWPALSARMKNSQNALVIADGYLNVAFFVKPAPFVEAPPFFEHSPHGVKRLNCPSIYWLVINDAVQMLENGTIEKAKNPVFVRLALGAFVLRDGQSCFALKRDKGFIGDFKKIKVFAGCKVQTIPQVDDGPNDGGMGIIPALRFPFRPFQSPLWIRFPKIRPRPKPIEFMITVKNIRAVSNCTFGYTAFTPMVAKHKRSGKAAQAATLAFLGVPPNSARSVPFLV